MGVISVDLGSNPLSFHAAWSGFWKKSLKERQAQLAKLLEGLWGPSEVKDAPKPTSAPSAHGARSESRRPKVGTDHKEADRQRILAEKGGKKLPCERHLQDSAKSTAGSAYVECDGSHLTLPKLEDQFADMMIENCIGTISLPVGLGLNLTINGRPVVVPMCVEESSVVAAASSAAKTISLSGGFSCSSSERNIIATQVQLCLSSASDVDRVIEILENNRVQIMKKGNEFCPNMVKRGGGVVGVEFYKVVPPESYALECYPHTPDTADLPCWVLANIKTDVCEAMGANCANTIAEGISSYLSEITGVPCGMRIVSNFLSDKLSTASFCIDVNSLSYKNTSGIELAKKIVESNIWAACDINRATTHNKGIMNGVDAVALATGQDWRAVEAAAHAYAAVKDPRTRYAPLTDYWIDTDNTNCSHGERSLQKSKGGKLHLHGSLSLPVPSGVKGGALSMNSAYTSCLRILGPDTTSRRLSEIIVSVGLAQNFAALRALCTVGIQSGHMSLHAQNIAVQAGVPRHLVGECAEYMKKTGKISSLAAGEFLASSMP